MSDSQIEKYKITWLNSYLFQITVNRGRRKFDGLQLFIENCVYYFESLVSLIVQHTRVGSLLMRNLYGNKKIKSKKATFCFSAREISPKFSCENTQRKHYCVLRIENKLNFGQALNRRTVFNLNCYKKCSDFYSNAKKLCAYECLLVKQLCSPAEQNVVMRTSLNTPCALVFLNNYDLNALIKICL